MSINSKKIKNFTVFKDVKIDFSPGINIFIGENGTGKTQLLKLIYAGNYFHARKSFVAIVDLFGRYFSVRNCDLLINGIKHSWGISVINGVNQTLDAKVELSISEEKPSVFIPAKEVLSFSKITKVAEDYRISLNLDHTMTEIIRLAENILPDKLPTFVLEVAQKLESIIGGKVFYDDNDQTFWIHKEGGEKIPFRSEAEGFDKLGLLWQLLMNRSIKESSVLLWDEPEANISRKHTADVVDTLLELSRHGVQVFLATHDYNLMKYFSVKKNAGDKVAFISLNKPENSVVSETAEDYNFLEHNAIVDASIKLLEDKYDGGL
jgi:energy-coupling factor transporter ATP-binding protein EcfA2